MRLKINALSQQEETEFLNMVSKKYINLKRVFMFYQIITSYASHSHLDVLPKSGQYK